MNWVVRKTRRAQKELEAISRELREEANEIMNELGEDGPAIFGAMQMRSNPNTWRVRFGGFRVVYRAMERKREILVTRIGPRATVYRGLKG